MNMFGWFNFGKKKKNIRPTKRTNYFKYEAAKPRPEEKIAWNFSVSTHRQLNFLDRLFLINRSRYFDANHPIAQRLADCFEEYVVGTSGIKFIISTGKPSFDKKAQEFWDNFAVKSGFNKFQGAIARQWFIDGEVFLLKTIYEIDDESVPGGKKTVRGFRVVDSCDCASTKKEDSKNLHCVDGIWYDDMLHPVKYSFKNVWDDGYTIYPASDVIHIYTKIYPNQLRGIPYLTPVLDTLSTIKNIVELEETNAINFARKACKIQSNNIGELDTEDLFREGLSEPTTTAEDPDFSKKIKAIYGDNVIQLQPGETLEEIVSQRPTEAFERLYNICLGEIFSGIGMGVEMFHHENIGGTTLRFALEEQNRFFSGHSNLLGDFLKEIVLHVLGGFTTFSRYERELKNSDVSFVPPKPVNIDIGYDTNKEIALVSANMKSLEEFCAERGKDPREMLRKIASEHSLRRQLEKEYGLPEGTLNQSGVIKEAVPTEKQETVEVDESTTQKQ